jgi:hypothetical protein
MSDDSSAGAWRNGDFLGLLARLLAPYLKKELGIAAPPNHAGGWISQYDSPLGRRRHLKLVREGVLPGKKVGRQVLVTTANMQKLIEGAGQQTQTAVAEGQSDDPLADWGLRPKRGKP